MTSLRMAGAVVLAALAGVAGGLLVVRVPLAWTGLAAIVIGLAAAVFLVLASQIAGLLPSIFLACLGLTLAGYAFVGRTFAYLGYPPLFIGEMVLAFGLLAVLFTPARYQVLRSPLALALGVFLTWGAARTLPFVRTAGTDALRDAVVWSYAFFALLTAACLVHTGAIAAAIRSYGRSLPLFIAWVPCAFVVVRLAGEGMPRLPWAPVDLVSFKPGDIGVHLAGAAVFLLLGLDAAPGRAPRRTGGALLLGGWLLGCVIAISLNRGAMMALVTALSLAGLLHVRAVGLPLAAAGIAAAGGASVVLLASDSGTPPSPEVHRIVSVSQVAENIRSIVGSSQQGNLEGTREWRMQWWTDIVSYTVHGEYFWGGKGFGVNLADEDGRQVLSDSVRSDLGGDGEAPLRSPHSIHLTVLARMGVPGFLLWIVLNATFLVAMLAGHVRCRLAGQQWWAGACTWLLAYWTAMLVNASFDVYIEGPPGGIWFWSAMGAGIAVLDRSSRERGLPVLHSAAGGRP